jgi:hypothetical protein
MFLFINFSLAQSGFLFSVNSSPSLNFGYKTGSIIISAGTDFSYRSSDSETVGLNNTVLKNKYSLFVISPGLTVKYYLYEEDLSPFILGSINKDFPVIIDQKGDTNTEESLKNENDEISFVIGGGGDFKVNEFLFLGFETGVEAFPNSIESNINKTKSLSLITVSRVTLTYMLK